MLNLLEKVNTRLKKTETVIKKATTLKITQGSIVKLRNKLYAAHLQVLHYQYLVNVKFKILKLRINEV